MNNPGYTIRNACEADLDAINRVIESAVKTWDLPDRVKRLSLPTYLYNKVDLHHFRIFVIETNDEINGVIACDPDPQRMSDNKSAILIHGIFVSPDHQSRGLGRALLGQAMQYAKEKGVEAILVKAQTDATGFFEKQGMKKLRAEDQSRDYELRYWMPVE